MKRCWTWCLRHPKISGPLAVFVALFAIISAVGGGKPAKPLSGAGSPTLPTSSAATRTSTPAATTSAVALPATLGVKGRAPNAGYSRAQFGPAWTDDNDDPDGHNGCDTRNDVLRRA